MADMNPELKTVFDIVNPPFFVCAGNIIDGAGNIAISPVITTAAVWSEKQRAAICRWIAEAMNEKWERERRMGL